MFCICEYLYWGLGEAHFGHHLDMEANNLRVGRKINHNFHMIYEISPVKALMEEQYAAAVF